MDNRCQAYSKIIVLIFPICIFLSTLSFASEFIPNPKTKYAAEFIGKCESQQWFLNATETLLIKRQKTINEIGSKDDLSDIKTLAFSGMKQGDVLPKAIGEFQNLEYLFFKNSHLKGLPNELYTLGSLKTLDLSANKLSGNIPDEIGNMKSLQDIILKNNQYSGNIPASIMKNEKIKILDLSANNLTGEISANISMMTGLEYLSLSSNILGGKLDNLTDLTSLKALSLYNCGLVGEIPNDIYNLKNLGILDLSSNKLTGEISKDIANLKELSFLALDNNLFIKNIPDIFNEIPNIKEVYLQNNKLTGFMPDTLKKAYENGTIVNLEDNYLTGENLKNITNNQGNFTDGAHTGQFRLSAVDYLEISRDKYLNIYPLLKNINIITGNMYEKQLLSIENYETSLTQGDNKKVEIISNKTGIFVRAKESISRADAYEITVKIADNQGSDYSSANIAIGTDKENIGGGAGAVAPPTTPTIKIHKKLIDGFPDKTFRPDDMITREQMAKILFDAMGAEQKDGYIPFKDVSNSRWSYPYIKYAYQKGYMNGVSAREFAPEKYMSRAEFAACISRITNMDLAAKKADFKDVDEKSWYAIYVYDVYAKGYMQGDGGANFSPLEPLTRAQAVTTINRVLNRSCAQGGSFSNPFSDIVSTHWAYMEILEALTEHEEVK